MRPRTGDEAISFLLQHEDPEIRAAAVLIREQSKRRKRILSMVQDALSDVRIDMKYLVFDLECTRRERDELLKGE